MAGSECNVLPNGWCNASPLLPLLGLIHKKPQQLQEPGLDLCIFQDRVKITQTKRSAEIYHHQFASSGEVYRDFSWSSGLLTQTGRSPGRRFAELLAGGGSNANTQHVIKGIPIC